MSCDTGSQTGLRNFEVDRTKILVERHNAGGLLRDLFSIPPSNSELCNVYGHEIYVPGKKRILFCDVL